MEKLSQSDYALLRKCQMAIDHKHPVLIKFLATAFRGRRELQRCVAFSRRGRHTLVHQILASAGELMTLRVPGRSLIFLNRRKATKWH